MSEQEPAGHDLEQRCRAAVDRVLARYGWRLLDRETFVRQVIACVASGEVDDPWRAAIHVYCCCLHAVCCGPETPERQELGYLELQRYLYQLSFRDIAELSSDLRWEAVNETLLRVWQKRASYYKPGAFLAAVALELRNVVRPFWSRAVPPLPLEEYIDQPTSNTDADPLAQALNGELRERVRQCFDTALRHHPRAKQQLEAVWLKYIAGLDDEAIGMHLGKSVANVHVLRSRGLNHLRTAPGWQVLAEDLGLVDLSMVTRYQPAARGSEA
jgi:DNA-directed RNA polymerase specialized sigma24 family protein